MDYVDAFLTQNGLAGRVFCEPYAGGASVALALLERGSVARCILIERDPLIYAFWKAVIDAPDELCELIDTTPITIRERARQRGYLSLQRPRGHDLAVLGFAGLFLNRCNYSGILDAGPIGGREQASRYLLDCRFDRLRLCQQVMRVALMRSRIQVRFGDGLRFLQALNTRRQRGKVVVYVDPPYVRQGHRLYRHHYVESDHRRLARLLDHSFFPWIVTYDNEPLVHEMFSRQRIVPILLNYAVKQTRLADELLVSNRPLPAPLYMDHRGKQVDVLLSRRAR